MRKYVCMKDKCDFITNDQQEALDHLNSYEDYPIIVLHNNAKLECEILRRSRREKTGGVLAGPDLRNQYAINTGDEGGEVDTEGASGNTDRNY